MKVKEGINRNGNGSKRKVCVGRAFIELLFLQEHARAHSYREVRIAVQMKMPFLVKRLL